MKMDFILSQTTEYAFSESLKRLAAKAEKNLEEEFIVIVPETKTLFAERTLLEYSSNHAFCNIFVYSFSRLLKRLQVKLVFPLNKEAGVMIVRNLIMELVDNFVCYKKTALTVGFAENIYETIQQLKSSGVSPIELTEAAKKCPPALRIKLEDIALIYDAYENYISGNFADSTDKLIMLEKEIELSLRMKEANVYVLGFESLTASMAGVIKSILKNAKSLTVSAPFMHPSLKNSHISDNEVFEKFKAIAESVNIKYDPIMASKPLEKDFKQIYDNLFCYPAKPCETQGQVYFYGCQSPYEETRKIASLISEDVKKGKYRFKDICIYLANEDYKEQIESALEEFEIPYFSASPYEFESHPIFGFIKLLFQIVRKNYEAEDVVAFSKNALLELGEEVDDFENYVLKYGINHLKFVKPFYIEDELKENAEKIRKKIHKVVQGFSAVYNENLTINELVEVIFAFFDEFDMSSRLKRLEKLQKDNNDMRFAMATEQAYDKVSTVLKMMGQFLSQRKVKLDDFYTLLISGLETSDISLLPLGIDNVQVVSSADGLYKTKSLYVLGATDGNFPHREQDLGLIQDAEIGAIEGISEKKIEPTIRTINRRERYKVFELVLLPSEKLTISFSEKAESGEEEKMSSLVMSLIDLFTKDGEKLEEERVLTPFKEDDPKSLVYSLGSRKVAVNYLAENFSLYRQGIDYAAGDENIKNLYFALQGSLSESEKKAFDKINEEEGESFIKNADKLFFKSGKTSISELETYFACPFKHFASYGLRLKEKKEASLRALDIGDILHSVAEKFVAHSIKVQNFDIEKLAVNILNKVLEDNKYSEEENLTLINILREESKRLCKGIYDQLLHSRFKPKAGNLEKRFGDSALEGIKLSEDPQINLVGRIDRLDETDDYYRIIDYKTGKISTTAEDVYYGKKLQLAIYLSAVRDLKKKPAGVLYFPVHNEYKDSEEDSKDAYRMQGFVLGDNTSLLAMDTTVNFENPKSHFAPFKIRTAKDFVEKNQIQFVASNYILSEAELESMREYALAVSKKAVNEILEGFYKATPFKKDNKLPCDYCEFKNICTINSKEHKPIRVPSVENADKFYQGENKWTK